MAKKKLGRPPVKPAEKRVHVVAVKLNRAEQAAVRKAAGGLPPALWCRLTLLKAAGMKVGKIP